VGEGAVRAQLSSEDVGPVLRVARTAAWCDDHGAGVGEHALAGRRGQVGEALDRHHGTAAARARLVQEGTPVVRDEVVELVEDGDLAELGWGAEDGVLELCERDAAERLRRGGERAGWQKEGQARAVGAAGES